MGRNVTQTRHGRRGVDLEVPPEQRKYVALQHLKWGGEWIEPGEPVPVEPGRNYDSMVRHGQIQQVIESRKGGKR